MAYKFIFFLILNNTQTVFFNFQISTSVHLRLAKMAAHVLILLKVTAVIVNQDILAQTVKQVIIRNNQRSCFNFMAYKSTFCLIVNNIQMVFCNFQISTSVHLHLAKTAELVLILLEVTAVIVNQDFLAQTVKQVII